MAFALFWQLPEDVLALILRDWLLPSALEHKEHLSVPASRAADPSSSVPLDVFSHYPLANDSLYDLVALDTACCHRQCRRVLHHLLRAYCTVAGTVDVSPLAASVGAAFRWCIRRSLSVRSLYGLKVLELERFARSLQFTQHPENAGVDGDAVRRFFRRVDECHHVHIQFFHRVSTSEWTGLQALRFLLSLLPATHVTAGADTGAGAEDVERCYALVRMPQLTAWGLADPADIQGLWNLQDFIPQCAALLHTHVAPTATLSDADFPAMPLASFMAAPTAAVPTAAAAAEDEAPPPPPLRSLDIVQPPASLARTAAASVVAQWSRHVATLRLLNVHWRDVDVLRVLTSRSPSTATATWAALDSCLYHQALSTHFAAEQLLRLGDVDVVARGGGGGLWPAVVSALRRLPAPLQPLPPRGASTSDSGSDDDGPPLRYLRLHLTSRSTSLAAVASATQLRSDLAAWLVVRHATRLRSVTLVEWSVSCAAIVALARLLVGRSVSPLDEDDDGSGGGAGRAASLRHVALLRHVASFAEEVVLADALRRLSLDAATAAAKRSSPAMGLNSVAVESTALPLLVALLFHTFAPAAPAAPAGGWRLRHLHLHDTQSLHSRHGAAVDPSPAWALHEALPLTASLVSLQLHRVELSAAAVRWILVEHPTRLPALRSFVWSQFATSLAALWPPGADSDSDGDRDGDGGEGVAAAAAAVATAAAARRPTSGLRSLTLAPSARHVWDEATTTWLWRWLTTPPSLAAALAPAAESSVSSVSPAAVAWGCGAQLTSLTLWSCRVLCAAHVQRFVVRGPWQRLRRLSLEMIGDLDAPTDEDEAEDEAAEEAAYVSPVEELELNNCAELTVAGLRAFLFTATAATTGTADAAAEDAAAEAEEAVRWTLRRCWRRLRLVRLTAASLRPSPFGATAAAGAAAATATATVKQQLQALARDCDAVGIRLHDGYRFVSPAASASSAAAAV
eukprot:gene4695-3365_t